MKKESSMMVAFHSAPAGFFKSNPPHSNSELLNLVQKAASLGFKCFQVGPLSNFVDIDGKSLRKLLDRYGMERSVHVGGLFDAREFSTSKKEYRRVQMEIHHGIELCREINSKLVSFHPPFFTTSDPKNKEFLSGARMRFLRLVKEEVEYAYNRGITLVLESFCYPPFIFNGLRDFMQFILPFPSAELGILLEIGHLYQMKFNLDKCIRMFKTRLLDVHIHDATQQEDFRKSTHLPIGKGKIDFAHVINILQEICYDGWLTLEIHGDEREIVESKQTLESIIVTA